MRPQLKVMFLLAGLLLVSDFCWARQRSSTTPPSRLRYSISGTVRYDETNRAAELVPVELRAPTGEAITTVLTNSNGDFVFGSLLPGTYVILVDKTGYEPIRENIMLHGPRAGVLLWLKKEGIGQPRPAGDAISAREFTIPRDASKFFRKGLEKLGKKKDVAGSLPLFHRAIEQFPGYYEAYFELGRAQMQLGEAEEGERSLRQAVELSNGRYADADFALGSILCNREQFVQAEAVIRKGLAVDSASWLGHFELARALLGLNRVEEAESSALVSVQENPDYAPVYLLLANVHIRKRYYPAVKKDLDEYLRLEPNGPMSTQARQTRDAVDRALAKSQEAPSGAAAKP